MAKKRETITYDLKHGREVVYKGTTSNLERREQEHREDGKNFDRAVPTSRRMTEEGAKVKEKAQLETYRKNQGKNPKYNKDSDG